MSTDTGLERRVAVVLSDDRSIHPPDKLIDDILSTTSRSRPRARWLALIKEPPMRVNSNAVIGSPMARLLYVMALTLALVLAATAVVVGGASLLPSAAPRTIIVAADNTGDVTTIAAAVAMAADGDTVLVKPGTYPEHLVIDKDITIQGDGPREDVIIEFTLDSPEVVSYYGVALPNAVTLDEADATVRHLTVQGPEYGIAFQVSRGSPLLEDLAIDMPGVFTGKGRYAIHLTNGAAGVVRDVSTDGTLGINGGATPTVERIHLRQEPVIMDGSGAGAVIRDSDLQTVAVHDGALGTLVGNRIAGEVAVEFTGAPELRDNVIDNQGNLEPFGVRINEASPAFVGNTIRGQVIGIEVVTGAPTIEGNTIEGNTTGIFVNGPGTDVANALIVRGNTFCDNITHLKVPSGSTLTLDGNDVCDAEESNAP